MGSVAQAGLAQIDRTAMDVIRYAYTALLGDNAGSTSGSDTFYYIQSMRAVFFF